ncbi:MAG TPA: DUF2723 domain-containing protein [Anaerolineales bacterium]|nr:DUF2723 domain-containing protein [Anaerolineales bacterium]
MKLPNSALGLEKKDSVIALVIGIVALAAYVRTLAPDVLYADSAEFQCLSYTLGVTHSTGYPSYLFLGRLIGFLPINNPAWRISLLSAVCAAVTVGGVYLLVRYFTRNRVGAALGAVALGISYTFWSQAVIAEVYVPGMAFLVIIMLLLFDWQTEPGKRNRSLLAAALIAGIGFGVHASVWLVAPPAIAFVLWTLWLQRASRPEWLRSLTAGFIGAVLGLAIYLAAFLISDQINSPTSFIRTTLEPSRVFWKLQPEDFDSPFNHLKMTVISAQWSDALFPGGDFSFGRELANFAGRLAGTEFPPLVVLIALLGMIIMVVTQPTRGAFYLLTFLFSAFLILSYQVGDKYVFYLSLYIPLAVGAGTAMGFALDWIHRYLQPVPGRGFQMLYLLFVLFLVTLVVQPTSAVRWQALRNGTADFVMEDYPFPAKNLEEPRLVAQMRLAGVADNAVFVLDWRALFTTAYLAHVEKDMTNTLFFEAMPRGNDGKVAPTLITQLQGYLEEGRPVYTDQRFPGLEENFRLLPAQGDLYQISLRQ